MMKGREGIETSLIFVSNSVNYISSIAYSKYPYIYHLGNFWPIKPKEKKQKLKRICLFRATISDKSQRF